MFVASSLVFIFPYTPTIYSDTKLIDVLKQLYLICHQNLECALCMGSVNIKGQEGPSTGPNFFT